VILRGLEAVLAWAEPYVEYDQIPSQPASGIGPGGLSGVVTPTGPDYTALNSWIPGGTITQYVWSISYNNQLYPFGVDPNKFVLLHSSTLPVEADASMGGSLPPYTPLCLTVQGTRISSSGAGPAVAVSATNCGYHLLPLPGLNLGDVASMPTIAMVRQGASGQIVVTGHATPQAAGRAAPNLLVHFADAKSAADLKMLTQALNHTKRADGGDGRCAGWAPGETELHAGNHLRRKRRRLGASFRRGQSSAPADRDRRSHGQGGLAS
jgi:hypothetical protein